MRKIPSQKSRWTDGLWITRAAFVVGVVVISIGIGDPRLFQINVLGFLAIATIGLSTGGIVVSLWRIRIRSRRWRNPLFWLSIAINLALVLAVSFFYHRGLESLPYQRFSRGASDSNGP